MAKRKPLLKPADSLKLNTAITELSKEAAAALEATGKYCPACGYGRQCLYTKGA